MTKYFPPQFISDNANQASKPFIIPFGDNEQHVFKNLDQLNNTECWPTKEQLGLDKSQWEALVTATKSKFSITRGMPGTGKSFVMNTGIRTAIANKCLFDDRPILFLTVQNSTCDKNFKQILNVTEKITRIGNQSSLSGNFKPYLWNQTRDKGSKSQKYNDQMKIRNNCRASISCCQMELCAIEKRLRAA